MTAIFQRFDLFGQYFRSLSVGGWALLVGVVTLLVVCFQVILMIVQTKMMKYQLAIMQKQDELLAKRADFSVTHVATELPAQGNQPPMLRLEFLVKNMGDRTAKDFYWHLFLPQTLASTVAGFRGHEKHLIQNINGVQYDYYSGLKKDPLYPTRQTPIGRVDVPMPGGGQAVRALWQIISEDGMAPSTGKFGELTIP